MITASLHKQLNTASGKGLLSVDLELHKGAVTSLFGVSGVGKTMILRILAGLEIPDGGSVLYDNERWFDPVDNFVMPIDKRKVGFVFQDYGLFPNMTVEENIRFACQDKKDTLIPYYIGVFGLEALKDRKPMELSGGQKQRTAIARALVFKPKVLLLDEPFTAQDKKMSAVVQMEIAKYTEEHEAVTVLVTHDIGAVFQLSTYIYSIEHGEIKAQGTVDEVFLKGSSAGKNGIQGTVADILEREGRRVLRVFVNEQVLEIGVADSDGQFEKGNEIHLEVEAKEGRFRVRKI